MLTVAHQLEPLVVRRARIHENAALVLLAAFDAHQVVRGRAVELHETQLRPLPGDSVLTDGKRQGLAILVQGYLVVEPVGALPFHRAQGSGAFQLPVLLDMQARPALDRRVHREGHAVR